MTKPYQLHLFTLRFWTEVLDGERWEWRGEVKNTSSGEIRYFRDFHVLVQLLPMLLDEPVAYRVVGKSDRGEPFHTSEERKMSTATETVQQEVHATNRAFEAAIAAGDGAGAAAVYTTDGQALPPNGATISGRGALQSFWQAVMDSGVKSVSLKTLELQPLGTGAYEVGEATLMGEGGVLIDIAKFIVVWQQENGQWKWHRDIWNSNSPA